MPNTEEMVGVIFYTQSQKMSHMMAQLDLCPPGKIYLRAETIRATIFPNPELMSRVKDMLGQPIAHGDSDITIAAVQVGGVLFVQCGVNQVSNGEQIIFCQEPSAGIVHVPKKKGVKYG